MSILAMLGSWLCNSRSNQCSVLRNHMNHSLPQTCLCILDSIKCKLHVSSFLTFQLKNAKVEELNRSFHSLDQKCCLHSICNPRTREHWHFEQSFFPWSWGISSLRQSKVGPQHAIVEFELASYLSCFSSALQALVFAYPHTVASNHQIPSIEWSQWRSWKELVVQFWYLWF